MKKIMFIKKFGLMTAVLELIKTMTRRTIGDKLLRDAQVFSGGDIRKRDEYLIQHAPYKVGEIVAVSQPYKDIIASITPTYGSAHTYDYLRGEKGWTNKMYVKASLMPHRIRITSVKVERLQDISYEDCMSDGIYRHNAAPDALGEDRYKFISYSYDATPDKNHKRWWFHTPKEAFAALIDKVSGKGTWEKNPLVFAYGFVRV